MRYLKIPTAVLATLSCSAAVLGQEAVPRDPRALAILQQSFLAMGGSVPIDSVISGTVELTEGSASTSGTIRIMTRGLDQTVEEILIPDGPRRTVYSRGLAASDDGSGRTDHSLEWAATAQSACNPAALIAAAIASPDTAFEYVELEDIGDRKAHHIRVWNSFNSTPKLRHLAEFTARDIWIDAASGLPINIAYEQRESGGASDRIPVEVSFGDFRKISGVLFPFRIEKKLNGTVWAVIGIHGATVNTGLRDDDFPVAKERR